MARIRSIKPEFPHSESMGKVSRDARLAFVLMWTIADDEGRLRGNSRMLSSLLFPYDDDAPKKIDGWIAELESQQCIRRYEVQDSIYIEITKWLENQKIDRPSASKIPPFDESSRTLAEPSPNPRLRKGREGKGEEGIGKEGNGSRVISLDELSVEHNAEWLSRKRSEGRYVNHDEHFVLEQFKQYCRSKGKKYADYLDAYRNAFEWEKCQPKLIDTAKFNAGSVNRVPERKGTWADAAEAYIAAHPA